jgi:hypothetical protein
MPSFLRKKWQLFKLSSRSVQTPKANTFILPKHEIQDVLPQSSNLCALATELVSNIAECLEPKDLLNLRLVCKVIFQKTLHSFGLTCLESIRIDLTSLSLQRLKALTDDEQMGQYVQRLFITSFKDLEGGPWDLGTIESQGNPPTCYQILLEAIRRLKNCRSFYIDLYFPQHYKDIEALDPLEVTVILLKICDQTGVSMKSFSIDFDPHRTYGEQLSLRYPVQDLHLGIQGAWLQLEELSVNAADAETYLKWLVDPFPIASRLRKLSLNFDHAVFRPGDGGLIDLISSCAKCSSLREFRISDCCFSFESLSKFLLHFADNLCILNLWRIRIIDGAHWNTIFGLIQSSFPRLETISFKWLKEGTLGDIESGRYIVFPRMFERPSMSRLKGGGIVIERERKFKGEIRVFEVSYSGGEISEALDVFMEAAESV